MVRCSCGLLMGTHTVRANASKARTYHYYFCQPRRNRSGPCEQRMIRADKLEPVVWELVSGLLKDPERLAAGMDRLIEQEATWRADGPDRESEILLGKVSERARLRVATRNSRHPAS